MSSEEHRWVAWQPLTPRGVAAFARASLGRLLLVQLLVAVLAAAAIAWAVDADWFGVVTQAINRMPIRGEIRGGILGWQGDSPQTLAENRFLAITIDLEHKGEARSPAHVQVEFGQTRVKIFSLFGFVESAYPPGYVFAFNRPELWPWWGAWSPVLLALIVAGVIVGLLVSWTALASVYCWVAWLCGFFANRELTLSQSWRLAGAALMPGALVLTAGVVFYGLGALDPVRLLGVMVLHFVVSGAFVLISPFYLPRHPQAPPPIRQNPFDKPRAAEHAPAPPAGDR